MSVERSIARGACNCGTVAFEIEGELNGVYVCHCSLCRRFTGANGIAVVVVAKEGFRWLRGEDQVTTWRKPVGDWHAAFCRVCGSALPGENDPSRYYVPAGLLTEGGEGLRVKHHIWVDSKAQWDEIGGAGERHPRGLGEG